MRARSLGVLAAIVALGGPLAPFGCGSDSEPTAGTPTPPPPAIDPADRPTEPVPTVLARLAGLTDFDAWVEAAFEARLDREPEWASSLGLRSTFPDAAAWLDDLRPAFLEATDRLETGMLEQLRVFGESALSEDQELVRSVMVHWLEDRARLRPFRNHVYLVSHFLTGAQVEVAQTLIDLHPFETEEDVERYLLRLRQVGPKLEQIRLELLRRAEAGFVLPARLLQYAGAQTDSLGAGPAAASPFLVVFGQQCARVAARDPDLSSARCARLLVEAERVVEVQVLPGYRALEDALRGLIPRAPPEVGVGTLPDGAAYYAAVLRHHTTTDLDADAIHQRGLDLLESIHAEMEAGFQALGISTDDGYQAAFDEVARASGTVSGSAIVRTYEEILEAAEARLPEAFSTLPEAEWTVIGGATGGYYLAASLDGTRPGAFYAQATGSIPRYGMATLAYHEVVPGHHLQIALAQEASLPLFSNVVRFTAATEGWALYAERLAAELGWYADDPYGDLGRLQYEAFRAARLVVDTGIHALGWSFDRAQSFFREATGFSAEAAEVQIARYAAWPGQATAYMVGMQEILRIREEARASLGEGFDLRAFHARVLERGALPLGILAEQIDRWTAGR